MLLAVWHTAQVPSAGEEMQASHSPGEGGALRGPEGTDWHWDALVGGGKQGGFECWTSLG